MANLKLDDSGRPIPQIQNDAGTDFDPWKGENNAGRVTGDVAHDAVDAGKPVKIGGKAAHPMDLPADVATADRVNALFDLKGRLFVRLDGDINVLSTNLGNTSIGTIESGGIDIVSMTIGAINGYTLSFSDIVLGNITTGSITSGNIELGRITGENLLINNQRDILFFSAARTATTNSNDITNNQKNGVHVILDVTAITDTPSITLKIQGKDPASGKYYDILAGAAITGVGTNVYKVFPAATSVPNEVANDIIPYTWRVRVEHADADSITYSVGYSLT